MNLEELKQAAERGDTVTITAKLFLELTMIHANHELTVEAIQAFLKHWDAELGSRMSLEIPSAVEDLREAVNETTQ